MLQKNIQKTNMPVTASLTIVEALMKTDTAGKTDLKSKIMMLAVMELRVVQKLRQDWIIECVIESTATHYRVRRRAQNSRHQIR